MHHYNFQGFPLYDNKDECILKCKVEMKRNIVKITKERAIEIAMNHNCVSREIAEKYTNSELKEVLRVLKLKADF